MSTTAIETFCIEVERLICSGAVSAMGDEGLRLKTDGLRPLAAQVPAIAKVVTRAEAMLTSTPEDAGKNLLALAGAASALRASSAKVSSPAGNELVLAMSEQMPTRAAPVRSLYAVAEALVSKKKPHDFILDALANDDLERDLRLWSPLVQALGNDYLRDAVVKVIGKIGSPFLPVLQDGFKKKSNADAARLLAMGAILGKSGESIYRDCLDTGGFAVQLAAIECMRSVSVEEAERLAVGLMNAADKNSAEIAYLVRMLLRLNTPSTIESALFAELASYTLVSMIDEHGTRAAIVETALAIRKRGLSHPAILEENLFLQWVAREMNPRAKELLKTTMLNSSDDRVRQSAAHLLLQADAELEAITQAAEKDDALASLGVLALFRIGEEHAFERLSPLFSRGEPKGFLGKLFSSRPALDRSLLGPVQEYVVNAMSQKSDPRWVQVLAPWVYESWLPAMTGLGQLGSPGAVDVLLDCIEKGIHERYAVSALKDTESVKAGLYLSKRLDQALSHKCIEVYLPVISAIGDASCAPYIEQFMGRHTLDNFTAQLAGSALAHVQSRELKS